MAETPEQKLVGKFHQLIHVWAGVGCGKGCLNQDPYRSDLFQLLVETHRANPGAEFLYGDYLHDQVMQICPDAIGDTSKENDLCYAAICLWNNWRYVLDHIGEY